MGGMAGRTVKYAICFDFPESADPWFAALLDDGFGLTDSLANAAAYDLEADAERVLANAYGNGTRPYGVVVEFPS